MDATATLTRGDRGFTEGKQSAALLYVVLRCDAPQLGASRHDLRNLDEVRLGRGKTFAAERFEDGGVRVLALRLPDRSVSTDHARIALGDHGHRLVDRGSKNGTILDGRPAREATLRDGAILELGETMLVYRNPVMVGAEVRGDLSSTDAEGPEGLVTLVPRLQRLFDGVRKVAASSETVLLQGESGTGKEVVAQAVHELSGRKGRFVAINCGALPDTLIEGQLFGYVKGAFSGADDDRDGLVQAADGGTLFLDEIGELSPRAQAALLRVLQEKEVLRVGATRATAVDLRLVVASLRDLERMVEEGRFREDLYGRVAGMKVALPPLRDRREDLGLLVGRLLARQTEEPVRLTVRAARALFRHPWPRNIRELDKVLSTARVLADGAPIGREHLPDELRTRRPSTVSPPVDDLSDEDRALRDEIVARLREHEGNVTRVAEAMGKKRQQIQKWCRRLGVDAAAFRGA